MLRQARLRYMIFPFNLPLESVMPGISRIWMLAVLISFLGPALAADLAQESPSSRAYVGHATDADMKNFIRRFPGAAGTRLDDCQTCHRGGARGTDTEREYSPCGYCHLLVFPNPRYRTGVPKGYPETLNAYGSDYRKAGRTPEALAVIGKADSDGDGYGNDSEIAALRHPGDAASRPGQPLAPFVALSWGDIRKLPRQEQFMLMNTAKEPTDDYVLYGGVRVADLLAAAGVRLEGASGITVFAPDGYSVDYGIEDVTGPFPKGLFYGEPRGFAGSEKAFVKYPGSLPAGVRDGAEIPAAPWLLLAYERGGRPLEVSSYEKATGRLAGEGPYRLVRPQRDLLGDPARPGRPDRAQKAKAFGDGWDFNPDIDHNAGGCVRGACVIRINPAPAGGEEFDWKNGWPLVADRKIVLFGRGVR